jgi:hypothetical protein
VRPGSRRCGLDFQPYANADLTFRLGAPDDDLVTRLHLMAQVPDGRFVVWRSDLPGGRREEDESLTDTSARELRKEGGCALVGEVAVSALQEGRSRNPEPHHPHFPHPLRLGVRHRPGRGHRTADEPARR